MASQTSRLSALQHRVWRWHFFAGLMVVPFAVILAITGAVYLFKPQWDAGVEVRINARAPASAPVEPSLTADAVVAAAQQTYPGAVFRRLTLPRSETDNTMEVELRTASGDRVVWIDRVSGDVLHDTLKSAQFMRVVKDIHGNLMVGNRGSLIVELMASWMIVLIITGGVLWWPREQPWVRIFAPKFAGASRREILRRLHGAGGAWIGALILIILVSGLPWTQVWGGGFDRVKTLAGWDGPGQEWVVTLQSGALPGTLLRDGLDVWERGVGDGGVVTLTSSKAAADAIPLPLQAIVEDVTPQRLHAPVEIQPPRGGNGVWTVRSMTQNRPHRVTVHYDRWTGAEIMRIAFADHHPVQRAASFGIAFHEGALFGWLNQALGVLAAFGVIVLSVTGAWMWWRRRPRRALGVPPLPNDRGLTASVLATIAVLAVFLPLVAASLVAAWVVETLWRSTQQIRAKAQRRWGDGRRRL